MRTTAFAWLAALSAFAFSTTVKAGELSVTVTLEGSEEPVANAVVSVNNAGNIGTGAAAVTAEIYQKNRAFHPHVLVIPVGSRVDFPNRDNTQHHVYSFSPAKTFNIELYADRPSAPILFDKPGIVELGCNIHDHMQGFIVVSDSAATGQTDASGQVTLSLDTPIGEDRQEALTLEVWHPRLPDPTRPVTREIGLGQPALISLDLEPEPSAEGSLDRLQKRFREL